MPSRDPHDEAAIDTADPGAASAPDALARGLPAVGPDFGEELRGDEIDHTVPTDGYQQLPVVALGGSAGGIQALRNFFAALPPAMGTAYVVILHLSPDHDSTLPALLQSVTTLPVKAVEHGERLLPDRVYVIPPARQLTVTDGRLRLAPLETPRGSRVVADLFFRSLSDSHGPHAIAIVLSGADGDGANGIKRIKERGGLTIAQDPAEAEHASMPRSAIATGMVDWVLPVADMPARILGYLASESRLRLPPEEGSHPARPAAASEDQEEAHLREVLAFLRTRTGNDFTYYKRTTILRRVARRMQINGVDTLTEYLAVLRTHAGEATALLQDLLISVTNFFRDREAFAAVEAQIPALFAGKGPEDTVRVWCTACATGEEPYSMAILLHEHARLLDHPPALQVFGCDLDAAAIRTARAGVYPPGIVADVSEERIARFFTREPRGYRVRRELRESVLFAEHDLLRDAPFSRLDLVSCRNLLIYLDREAQDRALGIFHFALRPEGRLFLGSAETVEEERGLFAALDKKHRLYVRRAVAHAIPPVPLGAGTLRRALQARATEAPAVPHPAPGREGALPFASASPGSLSDERTALAELHFRLVERFAPPSVIVNAEGNIVHLSENVGRFLRPPGGGQMTIRFLQTVHPALHLDLRAALLRLEETRVPVEVFGVALELEGAAKVVDLRVASADELAPGYVLVSFGARDRDVEPAAAADAAVSTRPDAAAVVRHLERELELARVRVRDTVDRASATEEEYKSGHEELQSMNEELRGASEELETSREELRSLNEELTTVNHQLKHNVEELAHANSDLHNLMNASRIATVFLDRALRVMRYTPEAVAIFHLIPGDTGRPLADLKFRVDYPGLEADARQVLRTLVPLECEVGDGGGSWFLARLSPYRSLEDRIEGVVLTFVDISERKRAEEARRESEEKYRTLFRSMDQGYCIIQMLSAADGQAVDWRFLDVNPAFEKHNGLTDATGKTIRELAPDIEGKWVEIYGRVATSGESVRFEESSPALAGRTFDLYAFRVGDPAERKVAVLFTDITERKQHERRQAFLLKLSDALRPLADAAEIQRAATRVVGEHLALDRAMYAEITPDGETVIVTDNYLSGRFPAFTGEFPLAAYGSIIHKLRDGEPLIVTDIDQETALTAAEKTNYRVIGSTAFVTTPLIKDGRWVANLVVHQGKPRRWTTEEIAVLQETAERTWAAVERARAEAALRESEAKLARELADTQRLQRVGSALVGQDDIDAP